MPAPKKPAKVPKRAQAKTSTERQGAYLAKLTKGGGTSVRIDFQGEDLKKLDALVILTEQGTRAEVVRGLVRKAHAGKFKK